MLYYANTIKKQLIGHVLHPQLAYVKILDLKLNCSHTLKTNKQNKNHVACIQSLIDDRMLKDIARPLLFLMSRGFASVLTSAQQTMALLSACVECSA